MQILDLVCVCKREAEGYLNAPRLARGTIFTIFEVLCENLKPNLKHGNLFTGTGSGPGLCLRMSTSKEPQRNLKPFRLARNTIFAIFEVPRVGTIKILEGPHSHPQRPPRTTCLRQRGHPGAPTQNFSPPLAPESRALPYHDLGVLRLKDLIKQHLQVDAVPGSGGGLWGPLKSAKTDYDAHCTVGVVIACAFYRGTLWSVGWGPS